MCIYIHLLYQNVLIWISDFDLSSFGRWMGWMVPERSMALCNSGLSLPVCSWVCASFRLYNSNWIWIQHIYTILCFSMVCIVFCQYCNIIVTFTNTESCHVHHTPLDSCLANAQRAPAATSRTRGAWEHGCPGCTRSSKLTSSAMTLQQVWHNIEIVCNKQTKQPLMVRLHRFSCTPLHSTKHASSFSKATSGSKAPAYWQNMGTKGTIWTNAPEKSSEGPCFQVLNCNVRNLRKTYMIFQIASPKHAMIQNW